MATSSSKVILTTSTKRRGTWHHASFNNAQRGAEEQMEKKMKSLRLFVVSLVCVLFLCSCQKKAEKLCWWRFYVQPDASYIIENNKRHYVSELKDENAVSTLTYNSNHTIEVLLKNGDKKKSKIIFDKDCFTVNGETYRIIESSPVSIVFESCEKTTNDFAHIELLRYVKSEYVTFIGKILWGYLNYRKNVPLGIRSLVFMIVIFMIQYLISFIKKDGVHGAVQIICLLLFIGLIYGLGIIDAHFSDWMFP